MDDGEIVLGEIIKNKTEKVVISLRKYKGHDLFSQRVFFTKDGANWTPSNKGLAMNVRLIPEVIRYLELALEELKKHDAA